MKATIQIQNQSPIIGAKRAIGLVMAVLLLAAPTVLAASATWNGTTDATWAGTGNWSVTPVPGTGDSATFNNAGNGFTTIDLGGGVTISNVTVDTASAAAYTIGSGGAGSQTLTIDNGNGGIIVSPTVVNNQVVNANLVLGTNTAAASYTLTNGSGQSLTIAGNISGGAAGGTAGVKTLTILNSGGTTLSGNISKGGATAVTLVKNGTGTLGLSGTDSLVSGAFNVNAGTVNMSGVLTNSGAFTLGSASAKATLNMSGTSAITNNVAFFNFGTGTSGNGILNIAAGGAAVFNGASGGNFGGSTTASGALYNDGTFLITGTAANNCGTYIGNSTTAYGYFRNTGTATVSGRVWVGQGSGALGVLDIAGGTFTVGGTNQNPAFQVSANSATTASSSAINVTAGTLVIGPASAQTYTINTGNNNYTAINITGSGKITTAGGAGFNLVNTANANNVTTLTLANGGELDTQYMFNNSATPTSVINFDNGKLKAMGTDGNGLIINNTAVYIYSGGATIDANGFNPKIQVPLLAPVADGVSTFGVTGITLGGTTTGYIGAPLVKITGGGGKGAAAIANFNPASGTITSITVTAPGSGYTSAPTVALLGGNGGTTGSAAGTATATASIGAVASGGLTKIGTGTLFLTNAVNTYSGSTLVLGGTLSLLPSTMGVAAPLTVSNATLALNASSASSLNVSSMVLQNNAVLSINYGTLFANPAFAAINDLGTLTAPGANITINLNLASAAGLSVGQFPIIAYTGATLPDISNFNLAAMPPGITANLVNNTANHSIDLNITFIGQTLTWYGAYSDSTAMTNWDISLSTNWNTGTAKYLEYGSAPNLYGDLVTFDDSALSADVNLATNLHPSSVTVSSTLAYTFTGSGSLGGPATLTKNLAGSLFLGTSNSYTGGTVLNSGSLIITNDAALGTNSGLLTLAGGTLQVNGNTTSSVRPAAITGAANIGVLTNTTFQMGGSVTGSGALTKNDNGTLVIAGTDSATGATIVDAGTLNVTGLITNGTGSQITVASSIVNAQLTITGGTVLANKTSAPSLQAGVNNSGASGVIRLDSGTLTLASELWLSSVNGGYGAFTMNGGTATVGSWLGLSRNGGSGVLNVNGGNLTVAANNLTIGTVVGTGGNNAVATLTGGNTTIAAGGVYVGEITPGVLNVSGSATLTTVGALGVKFANVATTSSGILNLIGGTIVTPIVQQGPGLYGIFNFNGGTLKAATNAVSSFLGGLTAAYVYSGGAKIDDGGKTITVSQPLLAPQGYGVSSISLTDGGSGYIDTPIVSISGGVGSNATAVATVSGGVVTGITITSPGTGYDVSDSLSVSFIGGGASAVSPTVGTVSLAANVSGGLTKYGAGALTLSGANTYTGSTVVTNGSLFITPAHQTAGVVVVADGAKFGVSTSSTTNGASIGNLTLGNSGATTLAFSYGVVGNPTNVALNAGAITVNGTGNISIGGNFSVGVFPLLQYTSLSGSFSLITPRGVTATLSNNVSSKTLYVVISAVAGGIVWTGTNSVSPNLWDLNTTTNWVSGGSPTTYLESVPPGDAVTFNDLGSGTVLLSNTASPASVTISNSGVNYTFQGSGAIAGTTSLTKTGSGSITMSLAGNSYAGNTVVSNGTFQLGAANVIPDGAGKGNVILNGVLDLNTFSDTINNLSGTGTVDTLSGGTPTLTVNSTADSTFSGMLTNSSGALSVTKTGNNTLTLSGGASSHGNLTVLGGLLKITNRIVTVASTSGNSRIDTGGSVEVDAGATVNISGSTAWFPIGNTTGTTNTLTVNGGAVNVTNQFGSVVGRIGTGVLNLNGGSYLNNDGANIGFVVGDQTTAISGVVNLNGGVLTVNKIVSNNGANTFNFNGGTLKPTANAANFFNSYAAMTANVLAGGAVVDTTSFNITIAQPLLDGGTGGGLTKLGSGALYLDGASSYTGSTVVSNGVLAGVGSLSSPVIVKPGASIGAGDAASIGTLGVNNDLTIQGGATLRISKTGGTPTSDLITGINNANYGGTLTVNNVTTDSTALVAGDTFTLFSATAHNGNFTSIVGSPGSGLAYSFTNGVLSVVTAGPSGPAVITNSFSGGTLSLSWPAGQGWRLQMQTNSLSTGLGTNWVYLTDGSINSTNITVDPTKPTVFYRLKYP